MEEVEEEGVGVLRDMDERFFGFEAGEPADDEVDKAVSGETETAAKEPGHLAILYSGDVHL